MSSVLAFRPKVMVQGLGFRVRVGKKSRGAGNHSRYI